MPNNVKPILFNCSGFTLIEVMITLGITSIASLGTLTLLSSTQKNMKSYSDRSEATNYFNQIQGVLGNTDYCTSALYQASFNPSLTTVQPLPQGITVYPNYKVTTPLIAPTGASYQLVPPVGTNLGSFKVSKLELKAIPNLTNPANGPSSTYANLTLELTPNTGLANTHPTSKNFQISISIDATNKITHCSTIVSNAVVCSAVNGIWNGTTQTCEQGQTRCQELGGTWDTIRKNCDLGAKGQCQNYGGTWNDSTMGNRLPGSGTYTGQNCSISPSGLCTRLGGKWDSPLSSCIMNPNGTCTTLDGHWNGNYCEFSEDDVCKSYGGTWNNGGRSCTFDQGALCNKLTGNQNYNCNKDISNFCTLLGGNWVGNTCTGASSSTLCAKTGGTWTGVKCETDGQNACERLGGAWKTGQCRMTNSETCGSSYIDFNINGHSGQASGTWDGSKCRYSVTVPNTPICQHGSPYYTSGQLICKISGSSCPSGMSPTEWTTTSNNHCDGGSTSGCSKGRQHCDSGSHPWGTAGREKCTVKKVVACGPATKGGPQDCWAHITEIGCR